ncbi:cysteine desulfurase [bacterium]|nr:cysteine desulfurase [bacterium]
MSGTQKHIAYLDNGDSTQMLPEVLEAMMPYLSHSYGNPASLHQLGLDAENAVDDARDSLAESLGAKSNEIYFTASATESNNLALSGLLANYPDKRHVVVSPIEHASVRNLVKQWQKNGIAEVTFLDVDDNGMVDPQHLKKSLRDDTLFVSIIHGNNEIGTLQDIKTLGEICRERDVFFHSDMAQSLGKVPFNLSELPIDLASFNSHKAHGPKGVGALYVRRKVKVRRIMEGGPQEQNLRPGTENVPAIIGFAKAAEIAVRDREVAMAQVESLTQKLSEKLLSIPHTRLNGPGHGPNRLPGSINITFSYIEGEAVLMRLNLQGVYVSSGSACSSRALVPSHVLTAIGLVHEEAHGSIRYTLSRLNTEADVEHAYQVTLKTVESLRAMTAFIPEEHSERESDHAKTFYKKKSE